tara:strand:- start:7183 stop:7362 length:180 start_codon:yes stop_codon:yes gene_type:complete
MDENQKKWEQNWRWEINVQKHQQYLKHPRGRGKTSKEFKIFVKDFFKKNKVRKVQEASH